MIVYKEFLGVRKKRVAQLQRLANSVQAFQEIIPINSQWIFPNDSVAENPPAKQEMRVPSLGREDPLEKEMATHSNILAWEIPWIEEPCGLQPKGLKRIGQNQKVDIFTCKNVLRVLDYHKNYHWKKNTALLVKMQEQFKKASKIENLAKEGYQRRLLNSTKIIYF